MQKTIKEWDMIQALVKEVDDFDTEEQRSFITTLFENLDPHEPFLDQCSGRQLDWLYVLHDYYINGNEDAFKDI